MASDRFARSLPVLAAAGAALAILLVAGCEVTTSFGKKIDYRSSSTAPALEIPPDLTAPQYDERYNTALGIAARDPTKAIVATIAPSSNAQARIARSGSERWLVVKTTPEIAWSTLRQFWGETGFVLAIERPEYGLMETDWAENRAEIPSDFLRKSLGFVGDFLYTTYKRDKFRTRLEWGTEPGTVEIYLSHRGMEQIPTATVDKAGGGGSTFVWTVLPPNPELEAVMLSRLMQRFGVAEPAVQQAFQSAAASPDRARLGAAPGGGQQLVVDDNFERAWRRVGLALDRIGFTVVDRDRSKGTYYVRFADPDAPKKANDEGVMNKFFSWFNRESADKPEQYRIFVADATATSVVTVQDPNGAPLHTATGDRMLALLKDQLK